MAEPHQYARDEIQDLFLERIRTYIDYWHKEPGKNKFEALEGLVHSILVLIDGESADLPAFNLLPMSSPADQKYFREQGENWFPILQLTSKYDIAGDLHDNLFKKKEKSVPGKLSDDITFRVWARQLMDLGFTPDEVERVLQWSVMQAKTTPYSALDHVVALIGDICDGRLSKEEVLRNMEHILVITPRELKDIVWCMEYSHNYNHGADGHNRMNTVTKLAEHLGLFWNEEAKSVEIPRSVRVEEPATTGRAGGV